MIIAAQKEFVTNSEKKPNQEKEIWPGLASIQPKIIKSHFQEGTQD